jgi:hypothetical protein
MEIFQTFEHNGRVLQLAKYEQKSSPKPKASSLRKPGAGKFEIGQINLSAKEIVAGEALTLTAQISGKNIAYIYTDILLKDKSLEQFYGPVAREYIQADRSKDSRGISHPDWDEAINLSVRLSPNLRLLTDGIDSAFAFTIPEGYGNSDYWLNGLYTSSDGTSSLRARITFDNRGETKGVLGYKEQGMSSLPHELKPKQGDKFAPFVQILIPPTEENGKWETTTALSSLLTFSDQPLRIVSEVAMPAEYFVGLLIQDLDGGLARKYAPLTIRG